MASGRILFVTNSNELPPELDAAFAGCDIAVASVVNVYSAAAKQKSEVIVVDGDLSRLGIESAVRYLRSKPETAVVPVIIHATCAPAQGTDDDPFLLMQTCRADELVDKAHGVHALVRVVRRLRKTDESSEITATNLRRHAPSSEASPLVLAIDDDAAVVSLIEKIFSTRYRVVSVVDGPSAIAECNARAFAAVLCDLQMPGMNGADVYRAVAATQPTLASRFVFLTAHERSNEETEFFTKLANPVVRKPFTMRAVVDAVERVTKGSPAR